MRVEVIVSIVVAALAAASPGFAQLGMSSEQALNTNAATDSGGDGDVVVRAGGAGVWLAVWSSGENLGGTIGTDADIFVASSTNAGVTWSAPAVLNTNASADSAGDIQPNLATDGAGTWVALWQTFGLSPFGYNVLVARSADNGTSWTTPTPMYTTVVAHLWGLSLATDGAGRWLAAWSTDTSLGGSTDADILVARSDDDGSTWSAPAPLNANAATDSANDRSPALATDGSGHWLAVWHSPNDLGGTIGSDSDILVARSADNGATWSAPAALNSNAGGDDTFTDTAPAIETDGAGAWLVLWEYLELDGGASYGIFAARSTDDGATWSPQAAVSTPPAGDHGSDDAIALAFGGSDGWLAAWESEHAIAGAGEDLDILYSRSASGDVWTAPHTLNSTAQSDADVVDQEPTLATDGAGNWVVAWSSANDLGGTVGGDGDILVRTSSSLPVTLLSFSVD